MTDYIVIKYRNVGSASTNVDETNTCFLFFVAKHRKA